MDLEYVLGRSLLAAEAIATSIRSDLVQSVMRPGFQLTDLQAILDNWISVSVGMQADSEIAARVAGMLDVTNRLPELLEEALEGFSRPFVRDSVIHFEGLNNAINALLDAQVVTREEFDQMDAEARSRAFTVARLDSEDTIETVRDVLAGNLEADTSLDEFRRILEERIGESRLGEAHLETVYRTNAQAAFHRGMDELASNPVVEEVFPYQEYIAIHDDRAREEHLALETLGLSGTGIYRRDDPMWRFFLPPWGFNCRCTVNLLTVEDAARKGVQEASEWLRTGVRPEGAWRLDDIPFRPEDGFVGPGRR